MHCGLTLFTPVYVHAASQVEELEHSGLARQVSTLLTHHLARATNAIGNAAGGTEALQEVLGLLNNLSRSVGVDLSQVKSKSNSNTLYC
jgi:hypothetical protein